MNELTPTERAVGDAITAAIQAENPGSIVTGWALVAEATIPDDLDATGFVYNSAEGQSVAHTLGLLTIGQNYHLQRLGDAGEDND